METLTGCKVLITGANGFFGRHLITRLQQTNSIVHALSRSEPPENDGAHWWRGDLKDAAWLRDVVAAIKPDVVFHLASASLGGQGVQFVLPTFENDVLTTLNVLLALQTSGCRRLVLTASLEEPVFDGRPISISSPYAAAKSACTFYGLMFHQLYQLPVTILRPFMGYGPGQKPHKIIPYTIRTMLNGQAPQLSSGVRPVDWVYVDDVMSAFLAAAVRPEAEGKVIDLGSGEFVSVAQVVAEIHNLIPGAPPPLLGALQDRLIENIRRADTQTAWQILNWKATTPLKVGLAATVDFYRQQLLEEEQVQAYSGAVQRS